ncbi:neutral/alkaline non-lysosomal ceramidase N-terminal domain-containing protein [Haloarchaeobius sp. DFWS5]|uniref:neutral/alkaline non-lysosomal ceramidase N-terminal domain-containing protein n=1 Tax=Haloarchaeobius sp. DFWS5 TaxID=3446114 RepID=UPI003EB81258
MVPPAQTAPSEKGRWAVGTATRDITPDQSMWMAGFAKRTEPSDGTEQELFAKATALEDGTGTVAVIATADVLFVPRTMRERVVERVTSGRGLDPDAVMVTATHTHCGPEFREFKLDMYADEDGPYHERGAAYRERLEDELVAVIDAAVQDCQPAALSYSHARCGFAMNRRLSVEDGIAHVQNPDGPVDHDVPVLVAERDGEPVAILFGYACHTTTVFFTRFSGDWAGYATRYVEAEYPDATAQFVLGCAGDQNPYPRREPELVAQHGRSLANAVRAAVDSRRQPVRGPLRTVFTEQPVTFEPAPDRAELEAMCESEERYLRVRAERLLDELDETGGIAQCYPYPIQAFGFGDDLTLVGLGGEVLVEYATQLKESLPGPVWVAAYANAEFTYVPTADAVYEGGYEGTDAILRSQYAGPLEPTNEDRILRRARALADRVRGDRTVD